jgi:hypothetical protein
MATFPTGIAALTNPTTTDKMNVVSHAAQHIAANDEIEAVETALGISLANVVTTTQLDTDVTLSANSNTKVATQKAVKAYADALVISGGGIPIGYLDTDGTLATNSDVKVPSQKAVKTYVDALLSTMYPVGIVVTLGVSTNPATVFGFGTWTAIAGKVIVGIDGTQTEFDTLDETGGAKTNSHTHEHSHTHIVGRTGGTATPGGRISLNDYQLTTDAPNESTTDAPSDTSNLQPYIVKYVWQRTA